MAQSWIQSWECHSMEDPGIRRSVMTGGFFWIRTPMRNRKPACVDRYFVKIRHRQFYENGPS